MSRAKSAAETKILQERCLLQEKAIGIITWVPAAD